MGWYDEYRPLEYKSEGVHDYYDDMMEETDYRDKEMRRSPLSSSWSRGRHKSDDPDRVVHDMAQIRRAVTSLLKVHGIPKGTRVEVACLGQMMKGMAGFEDIGKWTKPYLFLDTEVYKHCDSTDVLDVYCGIALHEGSHLNHTREGFLRMKSGKLAGERKLWEGLFEDERIEELVRKESPGFSGYLHALKRALFEKKEFGCSLREWHRTDRLMSDFDRINVLIFGFIRCPYLLEPEMKKWRTLTGECVFDTLRKMFPHIPKTERQVEEYGQKLVDWLNKLKSEYEEVMEKDPSEVAEKLEGEGGRGESDGGKREKREKSKSEKETESEESGGDELEGEGGSEGGEAEGGAEGGESDEDGGDEVGGTSMNGGEGGGHSVGSSGHGSGELSDMESEVSSRMEAHRSAAEMDRKCTESDKKMEELTKRFESALREVVDAKTAGEAAKSGDVEERLKRFESEKAKIDREMEDALKERMDLGRFSLVDIARMMRRMETILSPLDKEETEAAAEADALRIEEGIEELPSKDLTVKQQCVIEHPMADEKARQRYAAYLDSVKGAIARMRHVFSFRLGRHEVKRTELKEGKLNRRMVGKMMTSDRLFYTKHTRVDKGIAIGILLDESGSMSTAPDRPHSHGSKAQRTLQVGVLLAEALDKVPGVELEVYSFHTCGSPDNDTLFRYLYGKNNPHKEAIANYRSGQNNYDYQALYNAHVQLCKWTTQEKKLLISVSDGAPCGTACTGTPAMRLTKAAIDLIRKQGTDVMQIAIDDFDSESMFGKAHVLKFTDIENLINDMRRYFTKVIRGLSS